jgi:hypothetical protein
MREIDGMPQTCANPRSHQTPLLVVQKLGQSSELRQAELVV